MSQIKNTYLPDYPDDHQIYANSMEVMGLSRQKTAATRFVQGRDPRLEFEREPTNPVDPHAIKVFGCWHGWFREKREHIGYVPREVAKVVADLGVFDVIRPRLARTYLNDAGFVQVYFEFTGPKGGAKEFRAALETAE